jgi:FkbM family methyltransferase
MNALSESRAGMLGLRAACAGLRAVFRHAPGQATKQFLWDRVVRPHILWRSFPIAAETRFGARLEGGFPDVVHSFVYFFGVWEPTITAHYRAALRPGDVVIDIGANVGLHTLLAARLVGPAGRVHAIEASPWIFARLGRNLAANGATNVIAHNIAVTAEPGPVQVFLHDPGNLGGTTIVAAEAAANGALPEAMVEGRPLADIVPLADILAARLIKIDVEGAEWLVAQGMAPLLARLHPDCEILVEVKASALAALGGSVRSFLALFTEAGFTAFELRNGYAGRDYIAPAPAEPTLLRDHDFAMADLLFRRLPACG